MTDQLSSLQAGGLLHPARTLRLMQQAIEENQLDLQGLTILTEMGSGAYVTTPLLAALAGADQVYALTQDSVYGAAADIATVGAEFARFCGIPNRIMVEESKRAEVLGQADVVTNLGFVRPLDRMTVSKMKAGAVIALMCEAWETRPEDVDLGACEARDIAVIATNEDYPGLEVFDFSGPLALKLLFEAEIEVYQSRIGVVSTDKFGRVIASCLGKVGADVQRFDRLAGAQVEEFLEKADAIILADYCSPDLFIGQGGQMEVERLRAIAPGIVVVPFAGRVDTKALEQAGIWCLDHAGEESARMARTFSHLGVKPVIDLHCAGLKVAEIAVRQRAENATDATLNTALGSRGHTVSRSENVRT